MTTPVVSADLHGLRHVLLNTKTNGAAIVDKFRYTLWRMWDSSSPSLLWVMCNPSTADGEADDPTIRKCVGFGKFLGFGGIVVVNLYAYRATDPAELRRHDDIHGENYSVLSLMLSNVEDVVFAWGAVARDNGPHYEDQVLHVYALARSFNRAPKVIKCAQDGTPYHPLMQPYGSLSYFPEPVFDHCRDCRPRKRNRGRK